jgi:diguanylate cyclase
MTPFTRRPLSRRGLWKLTRLTLIGISICVGVSLLFNICLFWLSEPDAFHRAIVCAVVLPVMLGAPMFTYMSMKLREMSQLNHELAHTATHDGLTSLLNRTAFTHLVNGKIDEIGSVEGGRGAFLLIDADYFKQINDRFGHSTGDEALRRIADQLRSVTRSGDLVGRLGGEEFGLFLPGAGMLSAEATAERLRHVVEAMELTAPTGDPIKLSISVGGLFFRNEISFELMFQRADRMLYEAKANGRNRVEFEEFKPC